jgi:hypothetical protein
MRYESLRKPKKCPACGAVRIATILFGMPDFSVKLQKDIDAGRTVLGGCCVSDDDPEWQCTECKILIFPKERQR